MTLRNKELQKMNRKKMAKNIHFEKNINNVVEYILNREGVQLKYIIVL